jgi:hypothetical protein
MKKLLLASLAFALLTLAAWSQPADTQLRVGFGAVDVSPAMDGKPVYLAGFGQNRKATKIHDPIMARAVVFQHDQKKIAWVSVDVVGLFYDVVQNVRKKLPGFTYVLVSSTHNHEGPDTMGLWGPSPVQSGIDPEYMAKVEAGIVKAVKDADAGRADVAESRIGTARGPDLLHDGREPYVKHDELVAIRILGENNKTLGIVVQWNCHPETLDSKNTEVSADYVGYTIKHLQEKHRCPVVYFTGTVGGLMTSLHVPVKNAQGESLKDGTFAKTERFGQLVGELADQALAASQRAALSPIAVRTKQVYLPLDNFLYRFGWKAGVLKRQAFTWTGDPAMADPLGDDAKGDEKMSVRSEVGWMKLGDLEAAAIPGEIYPELVLSKVQDPVDPGADFPNAPVEPGIYAQMKSKHRMIFGLANDEIGYILPKRQWDEKPPFCYARKKAQYGEANSIGPEAGPILCEAFRALVGGKN